MTNAELKHHGIKGQKWGVRRFQNPDGTLTAKGKLRELKKTDEYKKALAPIKQNAKNQGLGVGIASFILIAAQAPAGPLVKSAAGAATGVATGGITYASTMAQGKHHVNNFIKQYGTVPATSIKRLPNGNYGLSLSKK